MTDPQCWVVAVSLCHMFMIQILGSQLAIMTLQHPTIVSAIYNFFFCWFLTKSKVKPQEVTNGDHVRSCLTTYHDLLNHCNQECQSAKCEAVLYGHVG